jgi:hypothetical protein
VRRDRGARRRRGERGVDYLVELFDAEALGPSSGGNQDYWVRTEPGPAAGRPGDPPLVHHAGPRFSRPAPQADASAERPAHRPPIGARTAGPRTARSIQGVAMSSLAILGVIAIAGVVNAAVQRHAVHHGVDAWPRS